ncbi:MAG: RHS repeat-associated core domain-containing protein, partial [Sulfurovum sp.]|nr:RHS repeat-associated core domain-containing protein [Sulfurovum sp.]
TYYYHRDEKRIADNNSLLSVASEPKRSERSVAVEEGSIVALTNEEGIEVENISYDGHYGKILKHTKKEETLNPYGYTGRETDQEDLYYYRARYYDPTTQRFLSRDPIEFEAGDFNFYRYVGNDPVNCVDPSGLWSFDISNGLKFTKAEKEVTRHAVEIGIWDAYKGAKIGEDTISKVDHLIKKGILKYPVDGEADAYRHCLWSCEMTRELGKDQAKKFLDNHEIWNYKPYVQKNGVHSASASMMDTHNNSVGQECAMSPMGCKDRCMQEVKSKKSKLIKLIK